MPTEARKLFVRDQSQCSVCRLTQPFPVNTHRGVSLYPVGLDSRPCGHVEEGEEGKLMVGKGGVVVWVVLPLVLLFLPLLMVTWCILMWSGTPLVRRNVEEEGEGEGIKEGEEEEGKR